APIGRIHVEIKRRDALLDDAMIRKYLVRAGRGPKSFAVGVLTNFAEWQLYVAGSPVKNAMKMSLVQVRSIVVQSIDDIQRRRTASDPRPFAHPHTVDSGPSRRVDRLALSLPPWTSTRLRESRVGRDRFVRSWHSDAPSRDPPTRRAHAASSRGRRRAATAPA